MNTKTAKEQVEKCLTLNERKANLIDRALTLNDCQLAFVLLKAEQIMGGEDVPDPEKEPEKVKAEWEAFKADWEKVQAKRRATHGESKE